MAVENQGTPGFEYSTFRSRVDAEAFTGQQSSPLKLRLELLESFMERSCKMKDKQRAPYPPSSKAGRPGRSAQGDRKGSTEKESIDSVWDFTPGTLTIVDLSCPFVDESSACALFSICLDLFLESRDSSSRIIALDEAHKVDIASLTPTAALSWSADRII